jgi:CubicO group peptidase (beta-lactamase class C family)
MAMRRALVLLVFCLCAHGAEIPDTVAGKQFRAWLAAFNSRDFKTIRAFYAPITPAANVDGEALVAYEVALDTGGYDVVAVERATATEMVVFARERLSGHLDRLRLQFAAEPPHRQMNFGYGYEYETAVPNPPRGRLSTAQIVKNLDDLMTRLSAAGAFSGAVLLAKDGKPVFRKAYGFASRAYGVSNRPGTRFNIGSVTKAFTGVAVAQLAQAGKLSFDDTVGKHLPDYPNAAVRDTVTIHQLLTHTAGIVRVPRLSEAAMAIRPRLRTVKSWWPLFAERPPDFAPGSRWRYSNEGYIILGSIIEKVSGESYFDYVDRHVFAPAGMTSSAFLELDHDEPNVATGYTRVGARTPAEVEKRLNDRLLAPVKGLPSGGAYSTVDDLLRFERALFGGRLLSAELTRRVTKGQVETGEAGRRYGYGLEDEVVQGTRIVFHSGAVPGSEARFEVYPDLGYTVVSLCNCDYQVVHRRLRDWITRR